MPNATLYEGATQILGSGLALAANKRYTALVTTDGSGTAKITYAEMVNGSAISFDGSGVPITTPILESTAAGAMSSHGVAITSNITTAKQYLSQTGNGSISATPVWAAIAQADVASLTSDLALKANLSSPTFTGTPSLPTGATCVTQSPGDSSTKLASTGFVTVAIDNYLTGLSWKTSCRIATTANHGLTGLAAIDGVTPIATDRVLVKNNTAAAENGIYTAASGAWTRSTDTDTGTELSGATVFVREGTANGDTQWTCTNDTITLGSTSVVFAQVSGAGTYSAGTGLQLTGNQFSIDGTVATSSQLALKANIASPTFTGTVGGITNAMVGLGNVENTALSTWTGATSITTLGTITTGVWNGSNIAYSKLTLTGAVLNADLAGSIAASKLVGTDITTVGTLTSGAVPCSMLTGTLPDARFPATLPAASGINLTALNATNLASGTVAHARLGTGGGGATKFLREDSSWQTLAGGGDALVANPLSQFAATSSLQLRGVLNDENGTGVALFDSNTSQTLISPILGTPTSGNLANCTAYPASNLTGTLAAAQMPALTGDVTNSAGSLATVVTTQMSVARDASGVKLSGDSASPGNWQLYSTNGSGTRGWNAFSDANIQTTDITTNDVSISKHGFAPKAPNDATKYLNGVGAYAVPGLVWTDFTQDLGASKSSGTFDITGLSGLTAGKNILVNQTAQAIASKGNARDEFEMDNIEVTGYVVNATTLRCYWNTDGVVVGTYAFAYTVGA